MILPVTFWRLLIVFILYFQEWTAHEVLVVCRLVRSVNTAMGLQTYNITIISDMQDIELTDFKVQQAYFHKDHLDNGTCNTILCVTV